MNDKPIGHFIDRETGSLTQPQSRGVPSFIFGILFLGFISCFLILSSDLLKWDLIFITTLSGALALSDPIDAALGRRDLLSPRVVVGILIFNAVYISPNMHMALDVFPKFIPIPNNMEKAFIDLAVIQLVGVSIYFTITHVFGKDNLVETNYIPPFAPEALSLNRLRNLIVAFGLVSFISFGYLVMKSGGLIGWINVQLNYRTELESPGWLLVIGSSFPTLFFAAYAVSLKIKSSHFTKFQINIRIVISLTLLIAVIFVTSGLRGSRANVVWPALAGVIIVHLLFFRIRGLWIVLLAILALFFAGVYDVYKKAGTEGISQLQTGGLEESDSYSELGFGPQALLLGDFSRTAVQAVILDHWYNDSFELYLGRTYIGDALSFVPGAGSSSNFPNKQYASTDIIYGQGSAEGREQLSSRIYGLQGEAIINFGAVGAIVVFAPYAFLMNSVEKVYGRARKTGSVHAGLFVAFVIPIIILLFLSDMDNVWNNLLSKAMFPLLALTLVVVFKKKGNLSDP